jgi:hypothetical protein
MLGASPSCAFEVVALRSCPTTQCSRRCSASQLIVTDVGRMSQPLHISGPLTSNGLWCWWRLWVFLDIAIGAYSGLILWIVLAINDSWASAAAWADSPEAYSDPFSVPLVEGAFETAVWPAFTFLVIAWLGGMMMAWRVIWSILTQASDPRVVHRPTTQCSRRSLRDRS